MSGISEELKALYKIIASGKWFEMKEVLDSMPKHLDVTSRKFCEEVNHAREEGRIQTTLGIVDTGYKSFKRETEKS